MVVCELDGLFHEGFTVSVAYWSSSAWYLHQNGDRVRDCHSEGRLSSVAKNGWSYAHRGKPNIYFCWNIPKLICQRWLHCSFYITVLSRRRSESLNSRWIRRRLKITPLALRLRLRKMEASQQSAQDHTSQRSTSWSAIFSCWWVVASSFCLLLFWFWSLLISSSSSISMKRGYSSVRIGPSFPLFL